MTGLALAAAIAAAAGTGAPAVTGLDHIPIAVADLEAAGERYRELGFTLKPGTPHTNGIRNLHAKFADGTELELITAPKAVDPLTAKYVRYLREGDGPAFLALYAPAADRVAARLRAAGIEHRRSGALVTLPDAGGLGHFFFGGRNASPTDRPEHFRHANGAEALVSVWLAGDDLSRERKLLSDLGAEIVTEEVCAPDAVRAAVARFADGDVVLLPAGRQVKPGRRIVGATLRVRSLDDVRRALADSPIAVPQEVRTERGSSLFLPPSVTHGIWLEFRER